MTRMELDGPSKTIIVEPLTTPAPQPLPEPAPEQVPSTPEPVKVPA